MKRWKKIVLNHWRAKLASFVLAAALWLLIRQALP